MKDRQAHWENVYSTKDEKEVSWFQDSPTPSLDLIREAGAAGETAIIDIGGGASRLVDALIDDGFSNVSVLDLSRSALDRTIHRMGRKSHSVKWIAADITKWEPEQTFEIWHDRATFHFLTDAVDQRAYIDRLNRALRPGGHVIIGTFAMNGAEKCSGLPVQRHDAASLQTLLGDEFELVTNLSHTHMTPWGATQEFQFSTFRRNAAS